MDIKIERATELINTRLDSWYEIVVKNLPNFILAVVVLVAFVMGAKLIRRLTAKLMSKSPLNKAISQLTATFVYIGFITLGLFVSLGILNLDKTVTSLLAGAGVIGLALGFAFQDIAANFVSGILIAIKEPYRIGDIVEVDGMQGEVKSVDLRTTSLVTFQGIEIFVPNKYMFTKPLKNYTTTPKRRLDLEVGVSYNDNLREVEKVVKDSLEKLEGRIQSSPVEVFYKEFGASSINFDVRVWIEYPADNNYLRSRHEAIILLKEAFDKKNIDIPYPVRTLDLGLTGGEGLMKPLGKVFQSANS